MSAKYNMKMFQGATFTRVITWKDGAGSVIPLDGLLARFTVRKRTYDGDIALNLTTENNGIHINTTTDKMTIEATAIQTAAMGQDDYLYILELKDTNGNEYRLLYGNIILIPEVSEVI